ncbi:MAG: hypothetical protein PHW34_16975 [Hespellia sp.]|nr:hypothetical protein [Hespellia sp.]
MDDTEKAKQKMFETLPALKEVYSFEELVPYYITGMQSIIYSFNADPVELDD